MYEDAEQEVISWSKVLMRGGATVSDVQQVVKKAADEMREDEADESTVPS